MQSDRTTRRRVLLGAGAAMAGFAGCSGSDDNGSDTTGSDSGDGSMSAGGEGTADAGGDGAATPTTGNGPEPNCTRLAGQPIPYGTASTPFVFTFEYVDSWTVGEPLEGPGGRNQSITSPTVTVDGEPEGAGIRVAQRFEPLTASQVDEEIADAVSGDFSPFEVLHELEYAGETIRVVGFPDAELAVYRFWLPHGDRYYPTEIDILTSILRLDEDGRQELFCLDAIQTATETVRTSLRPNPETTIDSV